MECVFRICAWTAILLSLLTSSCAEEANNSRLAESSDPYADELSIAVKDLDRGSIDTAIFRFMKLRDDRPNDELVNKYLASAYATKGGLDLFLIVAAVQDIREDGKDGGEFDLAQIENVRKAIPRTDFSAREWIKQGNIFLSHFDSTYPGTASEDMHTTIVVYRAAMILINLVYILETVGFERLAVQELPTRIEAVLPEVIDTLYQIRQLLQHVPKTPERVQKKLNVFLKKFKLQTEGLSVPIGDPAELQKFFSDAISKAEKSLSPEQQERIKGAADRIRSVKAEHIPQ